MNYEIKCVRNEQELKKVLDMCYKILGDETRNIEYYTYNAWKNRLKNQYQLLLYAVASDVVISSVLGRVENKDSVIMGFKYITLGSRANAEEFYEKCGYKCIKEMHGQKIFQKFL